MASQGVLNEVGFLSQESGELGEGRSSVRVWMSGRPRSGADTPLEDAREVLRNFLLQKKN